MSDLGLRVVAFLAFAAVLGGSVWAAYEYLPSPVGADLATVGDRFLVAPGTNFTVPYVVTNGAPEARRVSVDLAEDAGLALAGPAAPREVAAFASDAGWLTFAVPSGAPAGEYRVELAAVDADGARLGTATVDVVVLADGEGYGEGRVVPVRYVGRYPDGPVFDTNVEEIARGPWPKAEDFRAHESWEQFEVTLGPFSNVVPGFGQAIEGMRPGQSKTVVVPPELGYGAATRTEEVPREVELQRERTVPIQDLRIQRRQWESHIVNSGQGDPSAYAPGDLFEIADELNTYRARLVAVEGDVVTYRFHLEANETYTFFPFWPNGSRVVAVNETGAVLRTDPTTGPEDRFTYYRPWENMTRVASVDETRIVLRHEVPEGHTYTAATEPGAPPTTVTVDEVREDAIVVAYPNPAPLAGRTLVFDITADAETPVEP